MASEDVVQLVLALIHERYGRSAPNVTSAAGAQRLQWRADRRRASQQLAQSLRDFSLDQAQELAALLWGGRDTDSYKHDRLAFLLAQLNAFVPGALLPLHEQLVRSMWFYPAWLYLGASPETTTDLQRLLDAPTHLDQRHLILQCLAWIGDERVQAQFRSLQTATDETTADDGALSSATAALLAGWRLGVASGRRDLYKSISYMLVPVEEAELTASAHPVAVSTPLEVDCGWCGRQLVALLDVDLHDPRSVAVLEVEGARVRVAHCRWCSAYATLYTDVDLEGGVAWSAANNAEGEMPAILEKIGTGAEEDLPEAAPQRLALGMPRRTAFETLGGFMLDTEGLSQFGGHPEWIQDCEYPTCHKCQEAMPCVGQVSWEDMDEFAEGMTYAFLCLPCGVAATTYQQT